MVPIRHPTLKPSVILSKDLRAYVKHHGLCDITAFLPLWISCHGWIHGLNTLENTVSDRTDTNWLESVYFHDQLCVKPRQKLPQHVIDSFCHNQFKQRILLMKLLGHVVTDTFQQMQVLDTKTEVLGHYNNDYDLMTGYDTYLRMWKMYHAKWDQQQRIFESCNKPIIAQLAFPPKALKWHTILDKNNYVPRDKWDKKLILNDFHATLQPAKHVVLEEMDIFDLPLSSEVDDEEGVLLAEIDTLMDYFCIPKANNEKNSTMIDDDLLHESLGPQIPKLLANLDLQRDSVKAIVDRFADNGVNVEEVISTVFEIKHHDRDLLLNRVLLYANTHINRIATLDTDAKQLVNNFLLDTVQLFSHLRVRQLPNPPTQPWLNVNQSVNQLETILQNKIDLDMRTIRSLQKVDCVDINRFHTSPVVHQLVKAYDLYILNTGFMVEQFQKSASILSEIISKIACHRVGETKLCPELLKYIIVRHPGRGSLVQLQPQAPIIPRGTSGLYLTESTPQIKRKRLQDRSSIATDDDPTTANDRAATFDLLDDTMEV